MEITIFKDITTEGVITSIEENSAKYHEGFYADMNNAPERKLVKESSADIKAIVKDLEAARVKINRVNTSSVNAECKSIVDRLELANAPFTELESEWKALRAKILSDEKEVVRLRAEMTQKEDDHEIGLLINKTFEFDKAESKRLEKEASERLRIDAEIQAATNQARINEKAKQDKINEENARLANKEHCAKVNRAALADLMAIVGLEEGHAKAVVKAIAQNKIFNTTINY